MKNNKESIEYIEYKDRKFALKQKYDKVEKRYKKIVLFLLNDEDKQKIKKAQSYQFYNIAERNKQILQDFLNDEDFCTILRLKLFGFDENSNMYGYAIDLNSIPLYNGIAFIRNFI